MTRPRPAPTIRLRRIRATPVTRPCAISRTVPFGITRPPSRCAHVSGSLFTVRSSAGSCKLAAAMRAGFVGAVMLRPAREQPLRRVERQRVEIGEVAFAFARDPPQHGIDEARIARGVFLALHQTHREIDGGVIGHIEKKDLRGAEQQGRVHARDFRRQRTFQHGADNALERAEPAQHGRRQHAHQRAVAVFERLQRQRMLLELVVERAASPQHAFKNIGRDLPRGQARDGRGSVSGEGSAMRHRFARSERRRRVSSDDVCGLNPKVRGAARRRNRDCPATTGPTPASRRHNASRWRSGPGRSRRR